MDLIVTIEMVGVFERVRFERGVPTVSEFSTASQGHQLHVVLKGEIKQNFDSVKGTPVESAEKLRLTQAATESMDFVRWLK